MAALEKIRSKAGLLMVIIGAALLAFILGDFSKCQFRDTNVAKVNGEAIDAMSFQQKVAEYSQNMRGNDVDPAQLRASLLDRLISEKLLTEEFEKVGITVSPKEMAAQINNLPINQVLQQVSSQYPALAQLMYQGATQMGIQTLGQVADIIKNPANYKMSEQMIAEPRAQYIELEKEIKMMIQNQKFQNLVLNTITPNDIDSKMAFSEKNDAVNVLYAFQPYSSLDDKDFKVTDEELTAELNKEQAKYATKVERRAVHYIALPLEPSQNDYLTATRTNNEVYRLVKGTKNVTEALSAHPEFQVQEDYVTINDIRDMAIKNWAATAPIDSVSRIDVKDNIWSFCKIMETKMEADSVKLSFIAMSEETAKAQKDSILKDLQAGKDIEAIKAAKKVDGIENQWMPIASIQGQFPKEDADKILNSNDFVTITNNGNVLLVKASEKTAPVKKAKIAQITYKFEPSEATTDSLENKLTTFITANSTAKKFNEKAVEAGLSVMPAVVEGETVTLGGIPNTRVGIKWAFDAKPGEVSEIFTDNKKYLVAVALDDVYKAGFKSINEEEVRRELTAKVMNKKKSEKMMENYKKAGAKDIASYASVMKSEADTAKLVTFMNPLLRGRVSAAAIAPYAAPNTFLGAFASNNGVYAMQTLNKEASNKQYTEQEGAMSWRQSILNIPSIDAILRDKADVKVNLIKFW